jgi:NTE family protein
VRIGDEHFFDGGLVNSIPWAGGGRGADTVWVLHVGRLRGTGPAAVLVAGRIRFLRDITSPPLPQRSGTSGLRVTVHVLPTGMPQRPAATWSNLRYRDTGRIARRAELAYDATHEYLEALP